MKCVSNITFTVLQLSPFQLHTLDPFCKPLILIHVHKGTCTLWTEISCVSRFEHDFLIIVTAQYEKSTSLSIVSC